MREARRVDISRSIGNGLVWMFAAGGVLAILIGVGPFWPRRYAWVDVVTGAAGLVVAAALLPWRHRLTPWMQHVLLVLGSLAITAGCVSVAGGPATLVAATFYAWPVVSAFSWFSLRAAIAHAGLVGVLYGAGLAVEWERPFAVQWIVLMAIFVVLAGIVRSLVGHLNQVATQDPLTGLPNRLTLWQGLGREIAHAERDAVPLAVAVLDLNGFKQVNDTRGHAAGDTLLVEVTRRWRAETRERDLLVRHGGDEFVLVMPETGLPQARVAVGRLLALTAPLIPTSAGVAAWAPGMTADDLVATADRELYADKGEHAAAARAGAAGVDCPSR